MGDPSILFLGFGSGPSNGLYRIPKLFVNSGTRCAIQRCEPAGVSFERGRGRFQGGSATSGLQTRTTAICGLRRNLFPRLSTADTQILSLPGAMGLPHAGCGQGGPGIRYCGSSSLHTAGNFTWIQNIFALQGFQLASTILLLSLSWLTVLFGKVTVHRDVLTRTSISSQAGDGVCDD